MCGCSCYGDFEAVVDRICKQTSTLHFCSELFFLKPLFMTYEVTSHNFSIWLPHTNKDLCDKKEEKKRRQTIEVWGVWTENDGLPNEEIFRDMNERRSCTKLCLCDDWTK